MEKTVKKTTEMVQGVSGAIPTGGPVELSIGDLNRVNPSFQVEYSGNRWVMYPQVSFPAAPSTRLVDFSNVNLFTVGSLNRENIKAALANTLSMLFRAYRGILDAVYLTETVHNDLHYSIILKEDTSENRAAIFSILDEPAIESTASEFPVYFQFYPKHLKNRIQVSSTIDL